MESPEAPEGEGAAAPKGPPGASHNQASKGKAPKKRGLLRRSVDWVWGTPPPLGNDEATLPAKALANEKRARTAAELARRALEPPEPFPDGPPDAIACGLYHQSIVWALKALAQLTGANAGTAVSPAAKEEAGKASPATPKPVSGDEGEGEGEGEATADEAEKRAPGTGSTSETSREPLDVEKASVEALWQAGKPDQLLADCNVANEEVADVRAIVARSSFEDYAYLSNDEQVRWARKLRIVAEGLLYGLEVSTGRYNPPWLARTLRVGLLLAILIGLVWGGVSVKEWLTELDNIARGKPWVISSTYPAGCRSPAQQCLESPNFFFHTQEQNQPWMEIDLGSPQTFTSVKIKNRQDCCAERAVPLVLEVSSDGQHWKQLARKNEVFATWHPEFPPVTARWVRLRVARKSILHLVSVDIYK